MTLTEGAETMGHGGRANIVDTRDILYFALFPNALISLHPDYVMLHTLWPRAVDRTDVVCEWFFEEGVTSTADAVDFWDQVNREDWHVCELTQPACRAAPTRRAATRRRRTTCTTST